MSIYMDFVKLQTPSLHLRFKRGNMYFIKDYSATFSNLRYKHIPSNAREVAY